VSDPIRVQLSRRKGWRMPDNTVTVARPGPWGNPFVVGKHGDAAYCVDLYKALLAGLLRVGTDPDIAALERTRQFVAENAAELSGKNLACWCKPGAPCHADVLLEIANRPITCDQVAR
jgi:hypothetical protein